MLYTCATLRSSYSRDPRDLRDYDYIETMTLDETRRAIDEYDGHKVIPHLSLVSEHGRKYHFNSKLLWSCAKQRLGNLMSAARHDMIVINLRHIEGLSQSFVNYSVYVANCINELVSPYPGLHIIIDGDPIHVMLVTNRINQNSHLSRITASALCTTRRHRQSDVYTTQRIHSPRPTHIQNHHGCDTLVMYDDINNRSITNARLNTFLSYIKDKVRA